MGWVFNMKYIRYIYSKLLSVIPVIFGVTLVSFFLIHFIPGDPVRIMLHGRATDEVVRQIYQDLGWDKPLITQYFEFLLNAMQGDLGKSYIQKVPVSELIFERLAPSTFLLIYSAVLSLIISFPLYVKLMSIIATIVMLNIKPNKSKVFYLVLGIALSVIIFYLSNFINILGKNERLPMILAIWLPLIILSIFNMIGMVRLNEK